MSVDSLVTSIDLCSPILSLSDRRRRVSAKVDFSGTIEGTAAREEIAAVGLFDRIRRKRRNDSPGAPDLRYLRQWAAERTGVEAYVEPQTPVTPMTVVLVAADGEWTRRPSGGPAGARRVGERLGIPVYDVQKVGYPQRMRDHDARRRIARRRAQRAELDGQ